ncbi:hypothetical protein U27_03556 [Candidatus Vecturithrix granuli]|uniref:Uncharacterized protein n=1 Tax=Vecturithrix granuli TaxID=1499967 RepID=A0A081BW89_VECG1|nr:hypothetical protein U27_03556 [Candidatus Vecturithrix granuli]
MASWRTALTALKGRDIRGCGIPAATIPVSIAEEIVALLNFKGGSIFWGIEDERFRVKLSINY